MTPRKDKYPQVSMKQPSSWVTGLLNQLTSRCHIMMLHFGRVLCLETVTFFTKKGYLISVIFDSRDKKIFCTIQFSNNFLYLQASQLNAPKMAATVYQGHVSTPQSTVSTSSVSELSHIHRGGISKNSNTYAQKIAALQVRICPI